MKILKFNEAEESMIISNDALENIISKLNSISTTLDKNKDMILSISNTLSNFKSKNKSSASQIDDSFMNLESIDVKIADILSLLDVTSKNLTDYKESGEKFIY